MRLSLNPQVVGVSINCQAALELLQSLTAHPHHRYVDMAPPLTASPFDELVPNVIGYRQVSDATLLYLVRVHGMKLVTFDQAIMAVCTWRENLELLTP